MATDYLTAGHLERQALGYASLGWPVLPLRPRSKEPATRHGVKDATTDVATIRRWWGVWPDANIGIATGAPGPQVLDVDEPGKVPPDLDLAAHPTAASARGPHHYGRGEGRGTIKLDYGELRGRGSYVVAPPSVHPTGKVYTWLLAPRLPLPPFVELLVGTGQGYGVGEHQAPVGRVPHGQRHPYLADFTVRLVRAGITDRARLLVHLRLEFGIACAQEPPPAPGYFGQLVDWALASRIADRERDRAEFAARWAGRRNGA